MPLVNEHGAAISCGDKAGSFIANRTGEQAFDFYALGIPHVVSDIHQHLVVKVFHPATVGQDEHAAIRNHPQAVRIAVSKLVYSTLYVLTHRLKSVGVT